jgi:hypothetical protein
MELLMSANDGVLLAALPSGGSDWVASCIQRANPFLIYAREFFCPMCNWQHSQRLEQTVGDTLHNNTLKMIEPISRLEVESLLNDTWRTTDYCFTKENYLAFQLEPFSYFFDIVVLVRSFEDTFPPNRRRVMSWYEHFFCSIVSSKKAKDAQYLGTTPMNRAAIGHFLWANQLKAMAAKLGLPILDFGTLMHGDQDQISLMLDDVPFSPQCFTDAVLESRKEIERPQEFAEQWKDAFALYDDLPGVLAGVCKNLYGDYWIAE